MNTKNKACPPPMPKVTEIEYKELSAEDIDSIINSKCAPSNKLVFGGGKHNLFIMPEAFDELKSIVCYGKKRAVNCCELQYQGLGYIFKCKETVNIVVCHFILLYSASRTPTYCTLLDEKTKNDSMFNRIENERELYKKLAPRFNKDENGYAIDPFITTGSPTVVLSGHTHPNLGCFFSDTDRHSHDATERRPTASFVCDPIRRDMKAMIGTKFEDAKVIVYEAGECAQAKNEIELDRAFGKLAASCRELLNKIGVNGKFTCHRGLGNKMHLKLVAYIPRSGKND